MKRHIWKRMGFLCVVLLFTLAGREGFAAESTYHNSIGMEFILVPAGTFIMGADKIFEDANDDETPQHQVTISTPFYLGKFEVTQAQWAAVMRSNPSKFKARRNPVEQVSWDDIQIFIQLLNQKEGHNRYRLPTEAEWEYAARAGTETTYSFGDDARELEDYAWYDEDYDSGSTHLVGKKQPNPWGFYDMHGNVWEWVQDWHEKNYYRDSPGTDPEGPPSGSYRVGRGGGWCFSAGCCRSAIRNYGAPDFRNSSIGFRLALSLEQ